MIAKRKPPATDHLLALAYSTLFGIEPSGAESVYASLADFGLGEGDR
jgi:hypothetical protein